MITHALYGSSKNSNSKKKNTFELNTIDYVFIIATLLLVFGDLVTTYVALGMGYSELNPLSALLISKNFMLLIGLKILGGISLGLIYLVFRTFSFNIAKYGAIALAIDGLYIVGHNLLVIGGVIG